MGEKGEGSGGEGGGNWEWGTPLSTPSILAVNFYPISARSFTRATSHDGLDLAQWYLWRCVFIGLSD